MREIIFRGKDKNTGEWLYGYYFEHEPPYTAFGKRSSKKFYIGKSGFADWGMTRPIKFYEVDPETIGQYTGLSAAKSYRGEKPEDLRIFEGDIVYSADWQKYAEIVLLDGCWAVSFGDNDV